MMIINQKATAIASYNEEKQSGKNISQAKKVLLLLHEKGELTDQEIAAHLNVNPGIVCARRNELVAEGKVRDSKKTKVCQFTHKTVILWEPVKEIDLWNSIPKISAQKKRAMIMELCNSEQFKETALATEVLKILNS